MIVRFALTPRSLHLEGIEEPRRPRILKLIVNSWGRLGRLVIPGGEAGYKEFLAELENVPQDLRSAWKTALKRYRFQLVAANLNSDPEPGTGELVALSDLVELIGHARDEFSRIVDGATDSDLELIPTVQFPESERFDRARELAETNIEEGEPFEKIWRERARPLAASSRTIRIVDRYCLRRFLPQDQHDPSIGLMRFLSACSELQPKRITVFAGYESDLDLDRRPERITEDLSHLLESVLQAGHLIEVRFVPSESFRKQHDRFIVFDYQVWEIGPGLEIFSRNKAWRGAASTLKERAKQHQEAMKRLELCVTHFWTSDGGRLYPKGHGNPTSAGRR